MRDPDGLLPLKPLELLILTMLSADDRHGYGLHQDIVAHTDGRIAPEAGNLYRHIRKLESEGLVKEVGARAAPDAAEERRIYYSLLPFGKRVLAAELRRLRAIIELAEGNGVSPVRP